MSKNFAFNHFIFVVLALSLASCSIKEDRWDCPCTLTINLSRCPKNQIVTLRGFSEKISFARSVLVSESDQSVKQSVTKGKVILAAYSGIADMVVSDNRITIPKGSECDPIFLSSYEIKCYNDSACDTVMMQKQFAQVTVKFIDLGEEPFGYDIIAKGSVDGLDILSMSPTEGEFEFRPEHIGEYGREFSFKVPRQKDDSLKLDVICEDKVISTLDIGAEIRRIGFDWKKNNLDDINISIDCAFGEMSISICNWDNSSEHDVII